MRKSIQYFFIVVLFLSFASCNSGKKDADNNEQNVEESTKEKKEEGYADISKSQLQGTWECSKYLLDNGREQDVMRKRQPDVFFKGDKVNYMTRDYEYKIEDKKVLLSHKGNVLDFPVFVFDGERLLIDGDQAKIYYQKIE